MTVTGMQAFRPERKTETHPTELPERLKKAFQKRATAWDNFQAFPPFYRRMTVAWVASAKEGRYATEAAGKVDGFCFAEQENQIHVSRNVHVSSSDPMSAQTAHNPTYIFTSATI